jgi:ATP-dependent Lon protease
MPIGGVKEKVLAAHRAGIKKVLLPTRNIRDLEEIPKEIRDDLEIVFVAKVEEVLEHALLPVSPSASMPPAPKKGGDEDSDEADAP